ncbi:hypothetical protein FBU30_000070 [Linnemannia zychae]|nr:hypothetical protein FBU30_000070 [Linnemannia zychae]
MAYITKDQLNLYLQKVNSQSAAVPGNTGTARSRSTLNGPRPPNFGSKVSSRKIFQDGGNSPSISSSSTTTPTATHIESAVKNLNLSSAPGHNHLNQARASSPILESMGESGAPPAPVIMESMGSDDYGPPENPILYQPQFGGIPNGPPHMYNTVSGFPGGNNQNWPTNGYGPGPHPQHHTIGYGSQPIGPSQYYPNANYNHNTNHYNPNPQQQPQYPVHLSQEQYLQLQQQQFQQEQEFLRQKHAQNAAAHGYFPTPTTASGHIQNTSSSVVAQPVPTPATTSKTITPRIVPIVDIPKYTTINPPKTEVETLNDEQDNDDWAPEPPPRDPPKKSTIAVVAPAVVFNTDKPVPKPPSRPHTPVDTIFLPERPPTPKISIPPRSFASEAYSTSASSGVADSPQSKLTSQLTTPIMTDTPNLAEEEIQGDRIPMPPPREFRPRSTPSPTNTNTSMSLTNRSISNGIFRVGSSNSTTSISSISSSSTNATSSSFRLRGTSPAPGTVRANSAKFNALAAAGNTNSSPKMASSKGTSSVEGSPDTTTAPNPWTTRKDLESIQKDSFSKSTETLSSKMAQLLDNSTDLPSTNSSNPASSKPQITAVSPEVYADKELPSIRTETPQSRSSTPRTQDSIPYNTLYDGDYDSKCTLTEEDKLVMIPLAAEESKEIFIEQEEPRQESVIAAPKPNIPPTKPARNSGDHVGGSSLFVCASCDEPISGTMITAMGKRWHSDHFVCIVCNLNLEHVQFFHKDGEPYCHFDYHEKFSPKCGHCNTPIENECLTALGKSWHPGHFFCRECGDPFEEDGYMVHDGHPYCEKDYLRLFAPKCTGCRDPIQGDFISALKGKWHRDCFGCTVCHIGFDSSSYYVENGKPYCKAHYKSGSLATTTVTPSS